MKAEKPTHIVLSHRSQHSEMLFRASDGMCVAQRKNATVVYGVDPNKKQGRVFIDDEAASAFLRGFVAKDDAGTEPVIEERDGETLIHMPEKSAEFSKIHNFN